MGMDTIIYKLIKDGEWVGFDQVMAVPPRTRLFSCVSPPLFW